MPRGGVRPGAGRKPLAEKYERPINLAEKKIADKLPFIVDRMLELAEGVKVLDVNLVTMEQSVYTRPPDRQAIQYLVDRIMGKPEAKIDHDVNHKGSIDHRLREVPDDALKQMLEAAEGE